MRNLLQNTAGTLSRRRIDPMLAGIVAGALILVIVGLIAIPLANRRQPALAPASTPEGVVQRFYQAAYAGDYTTVYDNVGADVRAKLSLVELQQQLAPQLRRSQMWVTSASIHNDYATVGVQLTHFESGGLFGSNEWTEQIAVVLKRESDAWKIIGGPFYIPLKP